MSQVKAKQLEGVHADQLLDNSITAIVDPTANDDVALGYKPSSVWVNTALSKVFICSDNSIGAAVWIEIKELPVAPSSTPLGYNDIRTSFTGANWSYEGLTNNGGGITLSGSIAVSGTAGWRYLVVDTLAAVSVETIPPAEIVADTQQFTPAPIFSVANNGYYSSVNPTYRIIAIAFFDGINLLKTISYGNGSEKNDDYWLGTSGIDVASGISSRLQFTNAMSYACGSNITFVDNGAGNDDTYGLKITSNKNQKLNIFGDVLMILAPSGGSAGVSVYKNGALYIQNIMESYNGNAANISATTGFNFTDPFCQKNDYYTFVITSGGTANVYLTNIGATNV